jgi:hypothetical protein
MIAVHIGLGVVNLLVAFLTFMEERESCYSFILSRTLHESRNWRSDIENKTLYLHSIKICFVCQINDTVTAFERYASSYGRYLRMKNFLVD